MPSEMAGVALGTIGAAASVVQLGDAALKLCRVICDFASELQDAKGDIQNIRKSKHRYYHAVFLVCPANKHGVI